MAVEALESHLPCVIKIPGHCLVVLAVSFNLRKVRYWDPWNAETRTMGMDAFTNAEARNPSEAYYKK